jgi:phosphate:Na+ symporter
VLENFEIAISAFASQDKILADQLLRHKHHINELERNLRNSHFRRLHAGLTESFETSAVHLDVLTNLKRINSHLTAAAYPILENGHTQS